jgi:hypothetical protein
MGAQRELIAKWGAPCVDCEDCEDESEKPTEEQVKDEESEVTE